MGHTTSGWRLQSRTVAAAFHPLRGLHGAESCSLHKNSLNW